MPERLEPTLLILLVKLPIDVFQTKIVYTNPIDDLYVGSALWLRTCQHDVVPDVDKTLGKELGGPLCPPHLERMI
jgi:hypothetical protein